MFSKSFGSEEFVVHMVKFSDSKFTTKKSQMRNDRYLKCFGLEVRPILDSKP